VGSLKFVLIWYDDNPVSFLGLRARFAGWVSSDRFSGPAVNRQENAAAAARIEG
jgi:hypothetical protein